MASSIPTPEQTKADHPFASIHALPTTRSEPMQVLCLGWPRTGTQSLKAALERLGYKVYHMGDSMALGHDGHWKQGLEAHYHNPNGPQFNVEEFDKLMGDYTATADFPSSGLSVELMRAYPDAKVVLNTRDKDSWVESMKDTIFHARKHFGPDENHDAWDTWEKAESRAENGGLGIRAFEQHELAVGSEAFSSNREILTYEVKEGWKPLCEFLGKDIPKDENGVEEPFPRKDSWAAYKKEKTLENLEFLTGERPNG